MGEKFLRLAGFVELEASADSEGSVLINGRSGVLYSCNATAAMLASELVKGADVELLQKLLIQHFEVSADKALRDIHQFIDALNAAGLLEIVDRPIIQVA
ncbi:MAG TPA: PqqD family protein [Alphaproteobacteria bacterium]|nr:PqqD family protein [Alphaproteobacteria bacterium]